MAGVTTIQKNRTQSFDELDMSEADTYFQTIQPKCVITSNTPTCSPNQECKPTGEKTSQLVFNTCLIKAIDEVLSSLGEPVKNEVYRHLQNEFNLSKCDIPDKPGVFSDYLHKIFGHGAGRLETLFIKKADALIQTNTQYTCTISKEPPQSNISFREYVHYMQS